MAKSTRKVGATLPRLGVLCLSAACLILSLSCQSKRSPLLRPAPPAPPVSTLKPLPRDSSTELRQVVESAIAQTKVTTGYDPSYVGIDYPGGDVAPETGVCSDVIVRGFRKAGIDLQKEVHEDMGQGWLAYPKRWGASGPDSNIDHRRVLNLMTYFDRKHKNVEITSNREDYKPGDIVAWKLSEGMEHIGVVVNEWSEESKGYLIVHNIGAGTRMEDVLFAWEIIGHYRYFDK